MVFIVFVKIAVKKRGVLNNLYIVDTNVLMSLASLNNFLKEYKDVKIPYEVLSELDNLKTAPGEKGYQARRAIKNIEENKEKFDFIYSNIINNNQKIDDIIISYFQIYPSAKLISNDLSMKLKAGARGIIAISYKEPVNIKHYIHEEFMSNEEFLDFLEDKNNIFGVPIGQFLSIQDYITNDILGVFRYIGHDTWDSVPLNKKIKNYLFEVKPKDIYQSCAIYSLYKDEFTVIVGPAGTGKTLLSFAYCLKEIKTNNKKVHIFINPVKTRNSEELGFYPGDRNDKLLQNFIGGILKNKIGSQNEVLNLIDAELINIYPLSDIRGIEIPEGDIMYITEAQNLSKDLIKLAIQRCAEGSKIIIEGDPFTQVDKYSFANENNGLLRILSVFTGEKENYFSFIYLPNIYRSKIASKAEEL